MKMSWKLTKYQQWLMVRAVCLAAWALWTLLLYAYIVSFSMLPRRAQVTWPGIFVISGFFLIVATLYVRSAERRFSPEWQILDNLRSNCEPWPFSFLVLANEFDWTTILSDLLRLERAGYVKIERPKERENVTDDWLIGLSDAGIGYADRIISR